MNYDQELLRRFYNRHGYADFAVVSAIAELSRDKTSFILTFTIDEGNVIPLMIFKLNRQYRILMPTNGTNMLHSKQETGTTPMK